MTFNLDNLLQQVMDKSMIFPLKSNVIKNFTYFIFLMDNRQLSPVRLSMFEFASKQ